MIFLNQFVMYLFQKNNVAIFLNQLLYNLIEAHLILLMLLQKLVMHIRLCLNRCGFTIGRSNITIIFILLL
jgi:hypothetical protein